MHLLKRRTKQKELYYYSTLFFFLIPFCSLLSLFSLQAGCAGWQQWRSFEILCWRRVLSCKCCQDDWGVFSFFEISLLRRKFKLVLEVTAVTKACAYYVRLFPKFTFFFNVSCYFFILFVHNFEHAACNRHNYYSCSNSCRGLLLHLVIILSPLSQPSTRWSKCMSSQQLVV